jgi:hypothetical protein
MAFYSNDTLSRIEEVVVIGYLDVDLVRRWNANQRGQDNLRATTGWYWQSRTDRHQQQQGFKTYSAAARDAYYKLVQHADVLQLGRRVRLKVVAGKAA